MSKDSFADLFGRFEKEDSSPQVAVPRPMLATAITEKDFQALSWPFIASPKIDGYRGLFWEGRFYARSGKPHVCKAIKRLAQELCSAGLPSGLDGEFIVPGESFNSAGGKLRQEAYDGPVKFCVFDWAKPGLPFANRLEVLRGLADRFPAEVELVTQTWVTNAENLLAFESHALFDGFEGVVIRKPGASYKHGRGTLRDQIMLKLKRFATAEARVLEVFPRMHNTNEQTTTPLGYAERSSAQAGLETTNVLGRILVEGINGQYAGVQFSIGTFDGLTEDDRIWYLGHPEAMKDEIITYKYFPTGAKDRPRHPVFIGLRPAWDRGDEK